VHSALLVLVPLSSSSQDCASALVVIVVAYKDSHLGPCTFLS